jgi:hypothetical protein
MSKPALRKATNALPTFLDDAASGNPEGDTPTGGVATDTVAEGTTDQDPESQATGAVDSAAAQPEEPVAQDEVGAPEAAPAPTQERAGGRAPRHPRRPRAALGMLTTLAGCLVMAGSMVVAVWNPLPRVTDRLGASPALTFVLGAALVGVGRLRRQFHQLQLDHQDEATANATTFANLLDGLQRLAERAPSSSGEDSPQQQDLQHVLIALQRQEEKLNNLTKATKMYGKPLMEIAAQTTEVAGTMHHLRSGFDTNGELQRQMHGRLENQLRGVGGLKADLETLTNGLQKLDEAVTGLATAPTKVPSLEPLQQHVARLEVAVQAIAQRLEDTEVRKSLLRLESAQEQANGALQQLSRQEAVVQLATTLQRQIEGATARMCDGLVQLRDGNLGGLETGLREVQREVAGVATSVAQIQAAVKGGGLRTGATAPTSTPAPAPAAAPTPTTAATPASGAAATEPTPALAAAAASTSVPMADQASGGNAYQTGTRSTTGKNVLGAIAKLKQMKN